MTEKEYDDLLDGIADGVKQHLAPLVARVESLEGGPRAKIPKWVSVIAEETKAHVAAKVAEVRLSAEGRSNALLARIEAIEKAIGIEPPR